MRLAVSLQLITLFPPAVQAQIMSVDLGHEYFKVAVMRPGKALEIVLNSHSKRKTPTVVSFFEAVRTFGDDGLAHMGKAPAKVPTFFHTLLGTNYTAQDVEADGRFWKDFGLGQQFYALQMAYNETRGTPSFTVGDASLSGEEVLSNILYFAQTLAEEHCDGKPVKETVITIPSSANLRLRQAIVAAAEIVGLKVLALVHETAAAAVQRAVDYQPEKGEVEHILFYNFGSRKAEVSITRFQSRVAGMVAGKTAPVVNVLGSVVDYSI